MIEIIDIGTILVGAFLAAFVVLRWGIIGYFIGIFTFWITGILRIELLYILIPDRNAAMLDASWVAFFGWVLGAFWCMPFLVGRYVYRWWVTNKQKRDE